MVFDVADVALDEHGEGFDAADAVHAAAGEGLVRQCAEELCGELAVDGVAIGGEGGGLGVVGEVADEGGLVVIHEEGRVHAGDAFHAVAALDIAIPEVDDIFVDGPGAIGGAGEKLGGSEIGDEGVGESGEGFVAADESGEFGGGGKWRGGGCHEGAYPNSTWHMAHGKQEVAEWQSDEVAK
jgi:hypothetical protein